MSKLKKRIFRSAFFSIIGLVGIGFALYKKAPDFIIHPRKWVGKQNPESKAMQYQPFSVEAEDGAQIVGWATEPTSADSLPVVLMIHGIGNNKNYWLETSEWLYAAGVATVAIDLRAHGESGGAYCTFGKEEKKDLKKVYDWLKIAYPNRPIGLWGHSLGGAVGLQALEYDTRWDFGIISSTFADFKEVVAAYQKRYFFGIPLEDIVEETIETATTEAGFDADEIRPEESAKHVMQPIFYIHGSQDDRINVSNAHRIFDNLASTEKSLHVIDGANHLNVLPQGGLALRADILAFILQQKHKPVRGNVERK